MNSFFSSPKVDRVDRLLPFERLPSASRIHAVLEVLQPACILTEEAAADRMPVGPRLWFRLETEGKE